MKQRILYIIILIFTFFGIQAQTDSLVKAIYIDNFFSADSSQIILGDYIAEKQLFDYAENCGYNYLILYGLSAVPLGNNPEAVNALRSFVRRAHEDYHIKLGCIGQSSEFFKRIHNKYQSLEIVDSVERLDSYNLEFEFWKSYHSGIYNGYYCENYLEPNGYSCDSIGAFEFAMDELDKIDSLAHLLSDASVFEKPSFVNTEIYIGWINEYHAEVLAGKVSQNKLDRILGAVYKPALADGSLNLYHFFHQTERLEFLGLQDVSINFLPIFAVKENHGNHLGDWLDTIGSIPLVWEHYNGKFIEDTSSYLSSIKLQGYAWYNYSQMPLCFETLGNNEWLQGPEGDLVADSIYSYQVQDYGNADRFYWELPRGVVFADSLRWSSEAKLIFSPSFHVGDTVVVRAANRCHISERQYFPNQTNGLIYRNPKMIRNVFYKNGEINILIENTVLEKLSYQIFNLNGQLIKSGSTFNERIKFQRKSGLNLIRLRINGNYESFIF